MKREVVLYFLKAVRYHLDLAEYLKWVREQNLKALLVINPGNPTGQLIPLDEMVEFVQRRGIWSW